MYECPHCLTSMDWCIACGSCACWCECWMSRPVRILDPRYRLHGDEYGQRTKGRLIDTVKPEGGYL